LSFAQFEREVTGERIRDKISASKKKRLWLGGYCPLGYDVQDGQLVINPKEAKLVRHIYQRYLELKSVRLLKQDLDRRGIISKVRISKAGIPSGGKSFSRGALYELLANPLYLGEVRHKKLRYPGRHQAIVERGTWEEVQRRLRDQTARTALSRSRADTSILTGKLFDENSEPLRAVWSNGRHGGNYRYYVSRELITQGRGSTADGEKGWRLAAPELERSVVASVRSILDDHAALATTLQEAGASTTEINAVLKAAEAKPASFDPPKIAALVTRVDLRQDGMELSLNLESLLPQDPASGPTP
jgi:site-specific DNA recombinase